MGFLIRCTFWLSLVLLAIPFGGQATGSDQPVGPFQALSAARAAIGDITGICERQPEACDTGKAALHTIGVRAREASRLAFEVLDDRFGEPDRETMTGTVEPNGVDNAGTTGPKAAPQPSPAG